MTLFEESHPPKPLAERLRPKSLEEVLGQSEAKKMLSAFLDQGTMPHLVFWGPPGCGKTTLSRLMGSLLDWETRYVNATSASVKEIRQLADESKVVWGQFQRRMLVFIDEIHRLNKSQQDVLLPILEAGSFVLAGSTTENPFFTINQAVRSRVQLVQVKPLAPEEIEQGISSAAAALKISITDEARAWIAERTAGDLRMAYTLLESAVLLKGGEGAQVAYEDVKLCMKQTHVSGDRKGDNHYDLASAFQKSLRGSDASAAMYYLARFIESGEDPRFIARRLLITASEDVGNADPQALLIATAAFRAIEVLGLPEGRIPLAQAVLYIAQAPKSNEAIKAIGDATKLLRGRALDPIPAHLRDAHYKGAATLGHGVGYRNSHDHPQHPQRFLPEAIADVQLVAGVEAKPNFDPEAVSQLLELILGRVREGDWTEVDMTALAKQMGQTSAWVRTALNQLVKDKRLDFKRLFRRPESSVKE